MDVVMFSGGIGSWMAAKRVVEQHSTDEEMVLLFADVKGNNPSPHVGEDEDTYRFINDAAANVGARLVTVKDGRDIWQVFKDDRFLGNTRLANCSKFLKQKPCRAWLDANCDPTDTTVYVGIDWSESHRLPAIERGYLPYIAKAPLTDPPYLDKADMIAAAQAQGLQPPRLYAAGYPHNNCGGGCVRAGQGQFELLLRQNPQRYAEWEAKEQELRDYLGKDVSILRDRTKHGVEEYNRTIRDRQNNKEGQPLPEAKVVPLTLKTFRERLAGQPSMFDADEFGGCGCFTDGAESV